jgi:CcmD family protein
VSGILEFLVKNSIYIVLIVVLVIWGGIFLFQWNTDKKLSKIENELEGNRDEE